MLLRVKPWAPDSGQSPSRAAIGNLAALGTNLAVGFGFFVFLGFWVDKKQGEGETWTLVGTLLGLLYMVYEVWKAVRIVTRASAPPPDCPPAGEAKK